jgi:serine protease Do
MFCSQCSASLAQDARYCASCGALAPPADSRWNPTTGGVSSGASTGRNSGRWLIAVLVAVIVLGAASGAVIFVCASHHSVHRAQQQHSPTPLTTHASVTTAPVSTAPVDFAGLYARQQSGVVRIETTSCDSSGVGTGFLLSPTLVATVDHVVDQSAVISLIDGTQRTTGTVIGSNPDQDLALIRADTPLTGFHFKLASADPAVGVRVAAIGFPIGDPITLTQGGISGLHRNINVDGVAHLDFIETDTPINPGNSGGPLLTSDGSVAGLVDAKNSQASGIAYAVPARVAAGEFAGWTSAPDLQPSATCTNPLGPSQESNPDIPAPTSGISDADAAGVVAAFNTYFGGINSGDYAAAWAVLSPRLQGGANEQAFAEGDATSYDFGMTVLDAQQRASRNVLVALAFTSLQDAAHGPGGDTCDDWTLDYTMIESANGSWLIDSTQPHLGSQHTTC